MSRSSNWPKSASERIGEPDLIKPFIGEVEQDLERAPVMIAGLDRLFARTGLEGYEGELALLAVQLTNSTTSCWPRGCCRPSC